MLNRPQLDTMRMQLIEAASIRPDDIKNFYAKYLRNEENGCAYLVDNAPANVALLYRGRLKHFDATLVPCVLAGKNPYEPKFCHHPNCLNPDHVA